jgi:hypothetical protein
MSREYFYSFSPNSVLRAKPEVVLAARWRRRANLKSPTDSTTIRYPISVPLTLIVYRSSFACFKRFYACKLRPEVVLAARWCHRRILMSPIASVASVFYRWSVDVLRLSCTVKKLFEIFDGA